MRVLAALGSGTDLGRLLLIVREGGLDVGDLGLGVLALSHDALQLRRNLLCGQGYRLESSLLGHGGQRGGALEEGEVKLLDLEERICLGHVGSLSSAAARRRFV